MTRSTAGADLLGRFADVAATTRAMPVEVEPLDPSSTDLRPSHDHGVDQ